MSFPFLELVTTCSIIFGGQYGVPPEALTAIYKVENGKPYEVSYNSNGSYDMGFMQINSVHLSSLSEKEGVSKSEIRRKLTSPSCYSVKVAAIMIANNLEKTGGDLTKAIGHYHSKTPSKMKAYLRKIYAHYTPHTTKN